MRTSNIHKPRAISPGACCLLFLGAILVLPFPAAADPIASAFTRVSVPAICGSVCVPAISESNNGGISGGILNSITSLDAVEFAEARIDLASGAAGVAVANDRGSSSADASHFDTWFCPDPIACAALATPGSFVPVTLNLHVSGSASQTPAGGFMNLSYAYDTNSLLGSSALGQCQFSFFEDPGRGLNAHIKGQASFFDYHTGLDHPLTVDIVSQGFNTGLVTFSTDLSVTSFIGGCATLGCNLSQGIFTDTQSLNAQIDAASDGSAQILSSLNTFRAGFTSDLPFVSADGRTGGAASTVPEPSLAVVLGFVLAGLVMANRRQMNRKREIEP